MNIEVLSGIAPRLYELVAPLVMSCSVLRQNNNYPFKTSKHYLWFVAMERDMVIGFIPVEIKSTCVVINNYYVKGEDNTVLASLINAVLVHFKNISVVRAVAHTRHKETYTLSKSENILSNRTCTASYTLSFSLIITSILHFII